MDTAGLGHLFVCLGRGGRLRKTDAIDVTAG
jgi:hypothetical protein